MTREEHAAWMAKAMHDKWSDPTRANEVGFVTDCTDRERWLSVTQEEGGLGLRTEGRVVLDGAGVAWLQALLTQALARVQEDGV